MQKKKKMEESNVCKVYDALANSIIYLLVTRHYGYINYKYHKFKNQQQTGGRHFRIALCNEHVYVSSHFKKIYINQHMTCSTLTHFEKKKLISFNRCYNETRDP